MSKPNYSAPAVAVTDAAETSVYASTFCAAVYVAETPTATGWPRGFLVRLTVAGSVQHAQAPGASYRIPGPFAPGDLAATLELKSAGGDSSTFQIAELTS
jgi:hypothetical protein